MTKSFEVYDEYFHRAKREGFRARSAYKLKDIQRKFRLIKKGDAVIDLGAAPGSFMQATRDMVGPSGKMMGFDLQVMAPFDDANMWTCVADINDKDRVFGALKAVDFGAVDVVTSDLAPKTTGIRDIDQYESVQLTDQAFYLATQVLKKGGHFVGKVFEGEDLPWLIRRVKKKFKKVKMFKPPSCRDRSFETYIVAMGYKG